MKKLLLASLLVGCAAQATESPVGVESGIERLLLNGFRLINQNNEVEIEWQENSCKVSYVMQPGFK